MNIEEAIIILKDYINTDRQLRNHSTQSDFDQFCEVTCMAIERLIATVEYYQGFGRGGNNANS